MRGPALMFALATLLVLLSASVYAVCTQAGFDQALCELSQARTAPFCGPRSLKRQFKGALSRAQRSVRQARRAFARGRSAKVRAALGRADQQLASVIVAAETVRGNNHISPECRTAISDTIGALRQSIAVAAGGGTTTTTTSLPGGGTTTTTVTSTTTSTPTTTISTSTTSTTTSTTTTEPTTTTSETTTTSTEPTTTTTTTTTLVNGCDPASATDLTGQPEVTVTFSGAPSFAYSPKCFVASAGTRVTFSGSFQFHPLVGGQVVNGAKVPDPSSPITPTTDPGGLLGLTSASFTLDTPRTCPFYCDVHALPFGMEGAAFIVP